MNFMGVATVAERYFPRLARWSLPIAAIEASRDEMAIDGHQGNEGTALWLGYRRNGTGLVRTVVRLRGSGMVKAPDFMSISPELINEVADVAAGRREVLLGQIHSHGFLDTDLSPVDRAGGFRVPGFLSVVAPNYALDREVELEACGFHFYSDGGWTRLPWKAVNEAIDFDGATDVEVVTVEI